MANEKKIIQVLDYGLGNVGSILNMLRHIGAEAISVTTPERLTSASGVILPGVGNFDRAMENLNRSGMTLALKEMVKQSNTPILGICLGMQVMCKTSEEGTLPGLGLVDADVKRFNFPVESKLKIPHMGWNDVKVRKDGTILGVIDDLAQRFYFVHSYYVKCNDASIVTGITGYGTEFVSAFNYKNITGVQFHPEKSHKHGMNLFRNFIKSVS